MNISEDIKSITYLKSKAADLLKQLPDYRKDIRAEKAPRKKTDRINIFSHGIRKFKNINRQKDFQKIHGYLKISISTRELRKEAFFS